MGDRWASLVSPPRPAAETFLTLSSRSRLEPFLDLGIAAPNGKKEDEINALTF